MNIVKFPRKKLSEEAMELAISFGNFNPKLNASTILGYGPNFALLFFRGSLFEEALFFSWDLLSKGRFRYSFSIVKIS